ncbi:LVIVD repeat-containing protein [Desulfosudis oleivorans]|uniref:LVIVD repeat protein n=1 Tax=Desulfosudis oleivorans (strain DSM 6200 / JCM 39069 / Hxd3) TaxID=96561 RepID=A8ZRT6_DESOH|nr:LVIVD repeat-containing protein [Desulfosudis oleivorans]ABW65853.1 LVIVD repeat protein [Desulfosudis oleivorans Hxd3]
MKQRLSRWMITIFCCLWATGVHALVGDIQLLNRWPMAGPNSIAIADIDGTDYVFVGDGEVVSVYDTTPALLSRFDVALSGAADLDKPGEVAGTEGIYGIFYAENHLYVACGNEGLQIFDVTDPLNVGTPTGVYIPRETLGRAKVSDVTVLDGYAYLTYFLLTSEGYDSGIQVIDVTNPANPVLKGESELPDTFADLKRAQGLHVTDIDGTLYAFVADLYNGLAIFDVNVPADPHAEASCYFTYAYDVTVAEIPADSGNYYAYVADDFAGLRIISFDPDEFTNEVDILYGAEGNVIPTCQYAGGSSKALSVTVDPANELVFVGDQYYGLLAIDVSDVAKINTLPGDVDLTGYVTNYATDMTSAYSVCAETGGPTVVYVADAIKGFQRASLVDPMDETTWEITGVENTNTPADADALFIDENTNYIYVVDDDATNAGHDEGLRIFYAIVSEEYLTFLLKGKLPTDGEAKDVYVHDGYVYVADGSKGLKIIDPGLPEDGDDADEDGDNQFVAQPELTGSCVVAGGTGDAMDVVVSGTFAYVAAGAGGLSIINVVNKTAPQEKGVLGGAHISDARAVWVKDVDGNGTDDYAYVADGGNGLKIVDISDKTNPALVKTVALEGTAQSVFELRGRAYVAGGDAGFHVVFVSDLENARLVSGYNAAPFEDVKDVFAAISNESPAVDLLWVATGKTGMGFFTYPPDVPPQLVVHFDTFGDAKAVSVFGDFAFLADGAGGLLATTVSTASGGATDEGWDWLAGIVPVDIHSTTYGGSSGCAVDTVRPAATGLWQSLKKLFHKGSAF